MVRPALLPVALAVLLVLAGCAGGSGGTAGDGGPSPTATPAPIEPGIANTFSTGARCVDRPDHGLDVSASSDAGVRTIVVGGNLTVPAAHYVVEEFAFATLGETTWRLDINTTADDQKAEMPCDRGAVIEFEATVELPDTDRFQFVIRQDGERLGALGTGPES